MTTLVALQLYKSDFGLFLILISFGPFDFELKYFFFFSELNIQNRRGNKKMAKKKKAGKKKKK